MNRRQFLATTGLGAIGTSALLASGAYSTITADRHTTIEVATDPDAYLGLSPIDTPNSDNYATIDENGHLAIDIEENPNGGHGVNSNSTTWFDGLFEICNQGTTTVGVYVESYENDHVDLYHQDDSTRPSLVGEEQAITLAVGDCVVAGIRTETHGVDATGHDPLFDETVQFVADVDFDPPFDPNPWLEEAQTDVGGLFIHDGHEIVAMEPGDQLPEFGVRIPIYANRSSEPIEVFVDDNDRYTQIMRGFAPYDGSEFIDGSRTPWARQPSRAGTPRGGDSFELVDVREGSTTDIEVEWQPIGATGSVTTSAVDRQELNEKSVYLTVPE